MEGYYGGIHGHWSRGGKEARLAPALWPKLWAKVGLLVKVRQPGAVGED